MQETFVIRMDAVGEDAVKMWHESRAVDDRGERRRCFSDGR
ncbi:MAG: hypothetical protein VYD18_06760 [Candidatus Latescibacterota bacterium]|nr:hypothetical protein [Candidatus Latescibacterota bacterium]